MRDEMYQLHAPMYCPYCERDIDPSKDIEYVFIRLYSLHGYREAYVCSPKCLIDNLIPIRM